MIAAEVKDLGLEASCEASLGEKRAEGRAHLEPTELRFKGAGLAFKVPLAEAKAVEAKGGVLQLSGPVGRVRLHLGSQKTAEAWARKVRYPRSLMDKLGVKTDSKVSVLGDLGPAFDAELRARASDVTTGRAAKGSDVIVVAMTATKDLARLATLRAALRVDGAIWVVWPKGRKEFREDDVRAAGPGAGLVDVKVASVSETLSGLKMVVPLSQRNA
jgi:hypothetical protein